MLVTMHSHPTPCTPGTAEQLDRYCRLFPAERQRLAPLLQALAAGGEDAHSRRNPGGHLAASGIVIRRGRLLCIHHPHLHRWIQPGGHLEPGEGPEQAALRETQEETGASVRLHPWHAAHPCPVDIDVHEIAENPRRQEAAHLHFDFRYLLTCTSAPTGASELRTRWVDPAQLQEPSLLDLMHKLGRLQLARI